MTNVGGAARTTAIALAIGLTIGLGACARTRIPVGLDGTVAVFSADPAHPVFGRMSDWVRLGAGSTLAPRPLHDGARLALEVTGGGDNAALIRRIDAPLLATPFLFWDWSVVDGPPEHPVRLVIGFEDRAQAVPENAFAAAFRGAEPPPFSRSLTLIWGASALQRGSLRTVAGGPDGRPHARYVVRGGRENRGRWWPEHLDLSQLHAMAWPDVDMAQSRVVFAGISTIGGGTPGTMRIAGLKLSR